MKLFRQSSAGLPLDTLACAVLLCVGQYAQAASACGPITVTATVLASCVVGASALAFPAATSAAISAANVDAVGNLTVNCTSGSGYTVLLDAGRTCIDTASVPCAEVALAVTESASNSVAYAHKGWGLNTGWLRVGVTRNFSAACAMESSRNCA